MNNIEKIVDEIREKLGELSAEDLIVLLHSKLTEYGKAEREAGRAQGIQEEAVNCYKHTEKARAEMKAEAIAAVEKIDTWKKHPRRKIKEMKE